MLREEQAGTPGATFVNDVTVTHGAAYFTDSRAAQIYALPLDGGPLRTIPLTGDFQLVEGNNLNGIAASRSGWLLGVQTATGKLFRIDPATGATKLVDLGGYVLTNGDGLLLECHKLSVVQNRLNQIAQFEMADDLLSGRLIRTLDRPGLRRSDDDHQGEGQPVRGERAVRHGANPADDLQRGAGRRVGGHRHG